MPVVESDGIERMDEGGHDGPREYAWNMISAACPARLVANGMAAGTTMSVVPQTGISWKLERRSEITAVRWGRRVRGWSDPSGLGRIGGGVGAMARFGGESTF